MASLRVAKHFSESLGVEVDLSGGYGLCQNDPAWEALRRPPEEDVSEGAVASAWEPPLGTSFTTSAMLEASASPLPRQGQRVAHLAHVAGFGSDVTGHRSATPPRLHSSLSLISRTRPGPQGSPASV